MQNSFASMLIVLESMQILLICQYLFSLTPGVPSDMMEAGNSRTAENMTRRKHP
jgi:hypothetical protein